MKRILTIVVTYNGMKWLDKCLSSVKESTLPSDLFIVDNGSTDGSIEFIRKKAPDAAFVESKENLGFGAANNLGLRYAVENGYDYVYLLNQDAWIEPDLLEKMTAVSDAHPEYGILSPLQVNKEKTRLDKNFSWIIPYSLSSDLLCNQELEDIYETDFTMAAHWLIPIKVLRKIGGFSNAFPHYGEDNNLIQRLHKGGYKVGIVPCSMGVHDRENRPYTKKDAQYREYIHLIVVANNPNLKHPMLSFLNRLIGMLRTPGRINGKYFFKSFKDLRKSIKYRREYEKDGAFIM